MSAGFAIFLLAALLLGGGLSLLQQRAYSNATKRMAEANKDAFGSVLISGRGKGRLRGAIVLFVVDTLDRKIIASEAMVGASVLSRFKPHPELLGSLATAEERTTDPHLIKAIAYAKEQYKVTARKAAAKARTAS
jgi:glucitol operon activator protein